MLIHSHCKHDLYSQFHYNELQPLHHNATLQSSLTANATCSHYSTTAATATWSSNSYHGLKGPGGEVGLVISGHNSKPKRALELV